MTMNHGKIMVKSRFFIGSRSIFCLIAGGAGDNTLDLGEVERLEEIESVEVNLEGLDVQSRNLNDAWASVFHVYVWRQPTWAMPG